MPRFLFTFGEGFFLGASLIVAIGAQNAFVLRQGLKREHVFLAAGFCALADLLLIVAGVFGLGVLVQSQRWFLVLVTWGGAVFLGWYGIKAALRAWHPGSLDENPAGPSLSRGQVAAALAAFTFLNPHVYLDTVLLLGGIGGRHPVSERPWFAAGAASASLVWFFCLAYGARWMAPWFRRPMTWRVLDALIALIMLSLAATLVLTGVSP